MKLIAIRPRARRGFVFYVLLGATAAISLIIMNSRPVTATEPPPPPQYTMTVNKTGGGDCTMFYIDDPGGPWTTPTSEQIQESFAAGTWIEVGIEIECPCAYRFDHWLVNGEEVEDAHPEHHFAGFYLNENSTAVAVFEPDLPDQESTIWKEHFTPDGYPHWGDVYDHVVSLSSDSERSFNGFIVNEDFLKDEMTSSGWTIPTEPTNWKQWWQGHWDGDWDINSQNQRYDADGDDDHDGHAFDPNAVPWNLMNDGDTFQIIQRMRVKDVCKSENNVGPWYATHTIVFRLIVNQQTGWREVFVTKSGVQGPGDPQT